MISVIRGDRKVEWVDIDENHHEGARHAIHRRHQ